LAPIKTLLLTGGKIHDVRAVGDQLQALLSGDPDFAVERVRDDVSVFAAPGLDPYELVVLYYEYGALSDGQKNGLLNWIAAGHGFVGVHAAAVSFCDCPEYRAMLGGHFLSHPPYRRFQVSIVDPAHPITAGLEEFFTEDEQYLLDWDCRVQVLATALRRGRAMPVAWIKPWGQGRVFYLSLGHDPQACANPHFATLLLRGAKWAAGRLTSRA
jgi:type 1 glutamine amidotransferase